MSESCPSECSESNNASSSSNKQQIVSVEPPAATSSPRRGLDEERASQCPETISAQRLLSSSSSIDEEITPAEQVPSVAFQANGHPTAMDSPSRHRESQPLLGRAESDITFNNFPGEGFSLIALVIYIQ